MPESKYIQYFQVLSFASLRETKFYIKTSNTHHVAPQKCLRGTSYPRLLPVKIGDLLELIGHL